MTRPRPLEAAPRREAALHRAGGAPGAAAGARHRDRRAFFVLELGGAIVAESVVLQADALHLLMDIAGARGEPVRDAPRGAAADAALHVRPAARRAGRGDLQRAAGAGDDGAHRDRGDRGAAGPQRRRGPGSCSRWPSMALLVNGAERVAAPRRDRAPARRTRTTRTTRTDAARATTTTRRTTTHDTATRAATRSNLRGAWLHLLGDALGAVAALVAALVIRFGGPAAADPIASFVRRRDPGRRGGPPPARRDAGPARGGAAAPSPGRHPGGDRGQPRGPRHPRHARLDARRRARRRYRARENGRRAIRQFGQRLSAADSQRAERGIRARSRSNAWAEEP